MRWIVNGKAIERSGASIFTDESKRNVIVRVTGAADKVTGVELPFESRCLVARLEILPE
jgi:hypothetical protein